MMLSPNILIYLLGCIYFNITQVCIKYELLLRTLQDLWYCAMNAKMRAADVKWDFNFCYRYKCFRKCSRSSCNICTRHDHNDDTNNVPRQVREF